MNLPLPEIDGPVSVEQAIMKRRTVRAFAASPLSMKQLSGIFWAAYGITDKRSGYRAVPSGGALYPLDIYAVVGENGVDGLEPGTFHYLPLQHEIEQTGKGDCRSEMAKACLFQSWMARAPVSFAITSEHRRICSKYGERGIRYAIMEAGHAGQNIFLQTSALGLSAGIVGAFKDDPLKKILNLPESHEPLLVMPVGKKESC